jgi:hypothetical protein
MVTAQEAPAPPQRQCQFVAPRTGALPEPAQRATSPEADRQSIGATSLSVQLAQRVRGAVSRSRLALRWWSSKPAAASQGRRARGCTATSAMSAVEADDGSLRDRRRPQSGRSERRRSVGPIFALERAATKVPLRDRAADRTWAGDARLVRRQGPARQRIRATPSSDRGDALGTAAR